MESTETPNNETVEPTQEESPVVDDTPLTPSPEDVTSFEEDDDPESNVGDEVEETAEEKAAAAEDDSVE